MAKNRLQRLAAIEAEMAALQEEKERLIALQNGPWPRRITLHVAGWRERLAQVADDLFGDDHHQTYFVKGLHEAALELEVDSTGIVRIIGINGMFWVGTSSDA